MKTQTVLLLIVAGVILYEHSKQQQSGIQWISCNDPGADPVMCALMEQQRNELLAEALL